MGGLDALAEMVRRERTCSEPDQQLTRRFEHSSKTLGDVSGIGSFRTLEGDLDFPQQTTIGNQCP